MDREPDVTASRVREVIERSGHNQLVFAQQVGMTADKLSKSLSSGRRFTSLELANIAELGNVTVEWLLGRERPQPALAARSDEASRVTDARKAAAQFAEARANLDLLGFKLAAAPHVPRPRGGRLVDQGSELAEEALQHVPAYVDNPTKVDFADLVEENFKTDVVVRRDLHCDGIAWRDTTTRLILVSTSNVPTRQRFSIAHELGHILANDNQELHVDHDVMDPTDRRRPSEMRANAFAAAFLMPSEAVRSEVAKRLGEDSQMNDVGFSSLVMHFAVSPSALAYRMSNLGLIDERQRDRFGRLNTARCAHLAGQVETYVEWAANSSQERPPMALLSQLLAAYLAHKTTLRPIANILGVSTADLRHGLEPMLAPAEDADQEAPVFAP